MTVVAVQPQIDPWIMGGFCEEKKEYDDDEFDCTWIYHERQQSAMCGLHALNNLVQSSCFSAPELNQIADHLDTVELDLLAVNEDGGVHSEEYQQRVQQGSENASMWGDYSIEVLRYAMQHRFNLDLPHIRQEGIMTDDGGVSRDVTSMEGFICNYQSHWLTIRKINGKYWNLDSMLDRPRWVSHSDLRAKLKTIQDGGGSIFCIPSGLPPVVVSKDDDGLQQQGQDESSWWKERELILAEPELNKYVTNLAWRTAHPNVDEEYLSPEMQQLPMHPVSKISRASITEDNEPILIDLGRQELGRKYIRRPFSTLNQIHYHVPLKTETESHYRRRLYLYPTII